MTVVLHLGSTATNRNKHATHAHAAFRLFVRANAHKSRVEKQQRRQLCYKTIEYRVPRVATDSCTSMRSHISSAYDKSKSKCRCGAWSATPIRTTKTNRLYPSPFPLKKKIKRDKKLQPPRNIAPKPQQHPGTGSICYLCRLTPHSPIFPPASHHRATHDKRAFHNTALHS